MSSQYNPAVYAIAVLQYSFRLPRFLYVDLQNFIQLVSALTSRF